MPRRTSGGSVDGDSASSNPVSGRREETDAPSNAGAARWIAWIVTGPLFFGVMAGSGVWALRRPALLGALANNRPLESDVGEGALHVVIATIVFVVIAYIVATRRARHGNRSKIPERLSDLAPRLAPLDALPFFAALRLPTIERDRPDLALAFIAIIAALSARGVYAWISPVRAPSGESRPSVHPRFGRAIDLAVRFGPPVIVVLLFAAYAISMSWLAIENHHALRTRTFDLGFYDNVFYQTIHGRALGCSFFKAGTHRAGHFDPILVVLSPLYLLHPRAELLLALQSAWLGAGIFPVYLIANRVLKSRLAGLAFAAMYVAYPALHGANLYEFHSLALVTPILLFALYFLEAGAFRAFFAVVSLALLCREDVSLLVLFVGFRALADGRRDYVRAGWLTVAFSLGYFVIVRTFLMPTADVLNVGPDSFGYAYIYEGLIPNNRGILDVVLSLVTNPAFAVRLLLSAEKLRFVVLLMLPLAFLPVAARPGRVMLLFAVLYCLLASHFALFSIHFHYSCVAFPIAFALAPVGLRNVSNGRIARALDLEPSRLRPALLGFALVASALCSEKFGALAENASFVLPTGPVARTLSPDEQADYAWVEAAAAKIPEGATVGVSNRLGPHVSNRAAVAFYPKGPDTQYVLVDRADLRPDELSRHDELVAAGTLVPITERGGMALYERRR